jgi:hypothetical protein
VSERLRVYFAEAARTENVEATAEVRAYVRQLSKVEGVYMASTRADWLALCRFIPPRLEGWEP